MSKQGDEIAGIWLVGVYEKQKKLIYGSYIFLECFVSMETRWRI